MSKPLLLLGLALLSLILLACGSAPAPAAPVPTPVVAVAAAPAEAAPPPSEGAADINPGEPGPLPVSAADPAWGNRDAPVTIVEFADFQCPFCSKAEATLAELRQAYGPDRLRIVWKNNPLPFHVHARPAALLAMAIFDQHGNDGFWAAHDALYAGQVRLREVIEEVGARFGVKPVDLGDNRLKQLAEAKVDADMALGKDAGVSGTPAFIINGVFLSGAQPYDKFATIIDEQLTKAKALIAGGTPPRRVYAELSKAAYEARPRAPEAAKPQPEDLAVHKIPLGKSPVRGKATALVTVVEFADYQCPFSARVEPTLKQLRGLYGDKLRLVYKQNPLPFHPRAEPASQLALEARAQKGDAAYWQVHDALFADQQHLEDADLAAAAVAAGLDAARAMKAVASHKHKDAINADQELADDVSANGTPHFFINGRRMVGAQPLEKFKAVIDEQLQKAEALVKSGTPADKVYDKIQATAVGPTPLEKKTVPPPTKDNPSRGPANAKVTVQFFGDFQCPFCKRVLPAVKEIEKAFPGKIRVVWRNLPLPMHKDAPLAAEAAMEAFQQKGSAGFWAMFELLFGAQVTPGGLERPALDGYAAQIGLDAARFARALDTRAHRALVEADAQIANDAGIRGTPSFIINGYFVSGAQPLSKFRKVVTLALGGAK
jgi:protein-disulfide isomerase